MKVRKRNRILMPVSMARDGENTFRQALFYRRSLSSQITLLHVVAPSSITGNVVQSDTNKNLQARAMVRLIRFVKIHLKGKIPENMKLRVEIGQHISIITEIARTERFDLEMES